jgi:RimJ/RimL family protein N-acetyltransferase
MTIRTPRLVLRRARESDLAAVHAMMSDAEAMRYWSTPPHADVETTRAWRAGMIAASPDDSDDYIVELASEAIGKLGAWRVPEVGFLFARPHWGKGYALEALEAFAAHSFARGRDHLTADVDPRNDRCLRLLARAGFVETHRAARTFQVGDEWCESVYLRLDRPG